MQSSCTRKDDKNGAKRVEEALFIPTFSSYDFTREKLTH